MKRILWWGCLLFAPAVLIGLEVFHPANFTAHPGMYQYLSQAEAHSFAHHQALDYFGPQWWLVLHMVQTPMVGLVAVGLLLMADGIGEGDGTAAVAAAWLARAAIFFMVAYLTVLDAIGGIGIGRSILTVQSLAASGKLSPQQVEGAALLLDTLWADPLVGGVGSFVSETASRARSPPRSSSPRPCCCRAAQAGPTWRCWWPSAGSCRRPMPRRTVRSPSRS